MQSNLEQAKMFVFKAKFCRNIQIFQIILTPKTEIFDVPNLIGLTSVRHNGNNIPYAPLAQLVEQLTLNQWVPGSSPWRCTNGPLVKWLRQRPLTPLTSVRIRYGSPAPCRMTQSSISCKHDIPPVSLLVASARKHFAGLLRGEENEFVLDRRVWRCYNPNAVSSRKAFNNKWWFKAIHMSWYWLRCGSTCSHPEHRS